MKGPCEHNWGLSTGSACKDCRTNHTPGFEPSTWVTAQFLKARESAEYSRYDCPDPRFSPGSSEWPAPGDRSYTGGMCGYEPIEREWSSQREWMHPLPHWNYMLHDFVAGTSPSTQQKRQSLEIARKWGSFIQELESDLLAIRAALPRDTSAMSTFVPDPAKSYECGSYVVSFDTRGRLVGLKRGP